MKVSTKKRSCTQLARKRKNTHLNNRSGSGVLCSGSSLPGLLEATQCDSYLHTNPFILSPLWNKCEFKRQAFRNHGLPKAWDFSVSYFLCWTTTRFGVLTSDSSNTNLQCKSIYACLFLVSKRWYVPQAIEHPKSKWARRKGLIRSSLGYFPTAEQHQLYF